MSAQTLAAPWVQHDSAVKFIAFDRLGTTMATADVDRQVRVWDVRSEPTLLFQLDLVHYSDRLRALDHVRGLAFTLDGALVVASGESLRTFQLPSGEERWHHEASPTFGFMITTPMSVDRSQDGRLVVCNADGSLEVYSPGSPEPARMEGRESPFHAAWLADQRNVVALDPHSIGIWDTEARVRKSLFRFRRRAYRMAVHPSRGMVALRTLHSLRLFDLDRGEFGAEVPVQAGLPNLAYASDGRQLASVEASGVQVYAEKLEPIRFISVFGARYVSAHPLGGWVIGTASGEVIYDR